MIVLRWQKYIFPPYPPNIFSEIGLILTFDEYWFVDACFIRMPSPSEISADRKGIGGVETIRAPEVHALQEPFFLPFYFFTFSRHARAHTECRCDGRQNTNRCLNSELPNFLVLHNALLYKFHTD